MNLNDHNKSEIQKLNSELGKMVSDTIIFADFHIKVEAQKKNKAVKLFPLKIDLCTVDITKYAKLSQIMKAQSIHAGISIKTGAEKDQEKFYFEIQ